MSKQTTERYVTVKYIADILLVTEWTVREWLKAGKLPGIKIGNHWKISESDFREFLRSKHG